jgi:hypothetical protein
MKEFNHYSGEDFQNYLDNNFTGDTGTFKNHLKECESCFTDFKAWSLVWSFAKNDLKTEPLRIDLAYVVANKVFPVRDSKRVFEKVMYGMIICLGIVCLFVCVNFLISHSIPAPFILLIIPICLYLLITYKEISIIDQKFSFD